MPFDGLHIGHYILLRSIGSGGMGEVYLAEDARIHRQVAIKIVRTEASAYPHEDSTKDAQRLFLREAKAIARLDHPHILPLFDYGEENVNGTMLTYLVMPFRPEGSLMRWLEQRNSELLSLADVVQIVRQAASALQYAHDQQIIHQDVKPSNFLMRANNERPHLPDVVLADFGVARLSSATSSVSHSIRGTPTYMAPEQWSGEPVPATDQYALAVMTYELLTGRPPFQGPPMRMMYLHTNTPPQPPSSVNPSLPKEVDTVLLTALAKNPQERFLSIAAFARALESAAQYSDASTVARAPNFASPREVRATLAISKREAQNGTTRTLNLAGGRQVTISVPAGAYDGHIIRLNDPSVGTLIITLSVKETEPTFLPSTPSQSFDKTVASSNPGILAETVVSGSRNNKDTVVAAPHLTPPISHTTTPSQSAAKQLRTGAILLIGLIILVLLASGGFFYIQELNHNTLSSADIIATTQAKDATVFAATVTINAHNHPTAVTQDGYDAPTPTASTTAPYPPSGATLQLNDPLSDNSKGYNWDVKPTQFGTCTFTQGAYHAVAPSSQTYHSCAARSYSFSNFAYQVELAITSGDCGGIIFRADFSQRHYYLFSICQDGSYQVRLYTQPTGPETKILAQDSNPNPNIHSGLGQSNLVAVVANNTSISLYVNDQLINSIQDSTYSQGQIGVEADSNNSPTEVVFTNAKVWTG